MKQRKQRLCLILTLALCLPPSCLSAMYKKMVGMKWPDTDALLETSLVRSMLQCVTLCDKGPSCWSYNLRQEDSRYVCELLKTAIYEDVYLTPLLPAGPQDVFVYKVPEVKCSKSSKTYKVSFSQTSIQRPEADERCQSDYNGALAKPRSWDELVCLSRAVIAELSSDKQAVTSWLQIGMRGDAVSGTWVGVESLLESGGKCIYLREHSTPDAYRSFGLWVDECNAKNSFSVCEITV